MTPPVPEPRPIVHGAINEYSMIRDERGRSVGT